jgi:hypothetical protein
VTDWDPLLREFSREMIEDPQIRQRLPAEVLRSGWLGFEGASEEQIRATETRLNVELPNSYREFLKVSDGWRNLGAFIYKMWPTTEVEWFSVRNQEWIDAYAADESPRISDEEYFVYGDGQDSITFRPEYLQSALEISDTGDSTIVLLNPRVVSADGEWEAWVFANWYPGARRYRSFHELVQEELRSFRKLKMRRDNPKPKPPGVMSTLWREIIDGWRAGRK